MPSQNPNNIPEDVLREAAGEGGAPKKPNKPPKATATPGKSTPQRRIFKLKRAGVVLSREEVKEIKAGRRKLRRDMKKSGIKSKREFEATASSLGLYFDKRDKGFLAWLSAHWLGTLIAALIALLIIIFIFSAVTRLRGHYTVNLSDGLFKNGFVLSETADFAKPVTELFAEPAEGIPCVTMLHIPADVDMTDGQHNSSEYFAYTYYIRNEGEDTVDFTWELELNSESKDLSAAAWIALYVDGELGIYAEKREDGQAEALPPYSITDKGYKDVPLALSGSSQFEVIKQTESYAFYRVVPYAFESGKIIKSGQFTEVKPGDMHKYTVVLWLEGDDPDADNSKIGGHLGVQMNFRLVGEEEKNEKSFINKIKDFFGM